MLRPAQSARGTGPTVLCAARRGAEAAGALAGAGQSRRGALRHDGSARLRRDGPAGRARVACAGTRCRRHRPSGAAPVYQRHDRRTEGHRGHGREPVYRPGRADACLRMGFHRPRADGATHPPRQRSRHQQPAAMAGRGFDGAVRPLPERTILGRRGGGGSHYRQLGAHPAGVPARR
jgi:hypothetical protein